MYTNKKEVLSKHNVEKSIKELRKSCSHQEFKDLQKDAKRLHEIKKHLPELKNYSNWLASKVQLRAAFAKDINTNKMFKALTAVYWEDSWFGIGVLITMYYKMVKPSYRNEKWIFWLSKIVNTEDGELAYVTNEGKCLKVTTYDVIKTYIDIHHEKVLIN